MPYQVLARKYRPTRFSDVVGQDHVTRTLLNALAQNRIAHGYIFSGHRGIGKTTIARILASALNCRNAIGSELRPTPEPCNLCESCTEIRTGSSVDVIEIDAATNRGIDEIRELRDAARYSPARDKFKIIILDEAHQITDAAFNALLKTLEEPPEHIVFMMATTQPEDIPQTIRSRCQHFSFHAVKLDDIVGQLRSIAAAEQIQADDATLALLAEAGDGSMRDALSIMDQAIASAPTSDGTATGQPVLRADEVRDLMGSVSNVVFEQILAAVHANNSADVLATLGRLLDAGNGPQPLARQFVRYLRNCTVAKITNLSPDEPAHGLAADLLQISPEERARAARSAALFTEEELSRFLSIILRTFDDLGFRQEPRFHLELGVLKLVHLQRLLPVEDLLSQLGATAAPPPTPSTTPSARPSPTQPSRPQPSPRAPDLPSRPQPSPREAAAERPAVRTATTPASPSSPTASSSAREQSSPIKLSSRPEAAFAAVERPAVGPATNSTPSAHSGAAAPERPPHFAPSPTNAQPLTSTAGALALAPEPERAQPAPARVPETQPAPSADHSADHDTAALHTALLAALDNVKGQQSASDAIHDATLTLAADTLQVQTTLSKPMLPVVLNAEAERLLKAALRQAAPTLKLVLLPGTPAANGAKKPRRAAASGSATELAEKHPKVQEAKRLFSAEISNVIDLRDKD